MNDLLESLLGRLLELEARMSELESAGLGSDVDSPGPAPELPPPIRSPQALHGDCLYAGGGRWSYASGRPHGTATLPAEAVGEYYLDYRNGFRSGCGCVAHEATTDTAGEVKLAFTRGITSPNEECVTQWSHSEGYYIVNGSEYRPFTHTDVRSQFCYTGTEEEVQDGYRFNNGCRFYYHPTVEDRKFTKKSYYYIGGVPGDGVDLEYVYAPWVEEEGD